MTISSLNAREIALCSGGMCEVNSSIAVNWVDDVATVQGCPGLRICATFSGSSCGFESVYCQDINRGKSYSFDSSISCMPSEMLYVKRNGGDSQPKDCNLSGYYVQ